MVTTTFCTSGAALLKAGANAPTITTADAVENFIVQAENFINVSAGYDFTANYASVGTNTAKLLEEVASNIAGMYIINYDMSGYSSRLESQTMLDVLRDKIMKSIELLKLKDKVDFMI